MNKPLPSVETPVSYWPTVELIRAVAEAGNRDALDELVTRRRLFHAATAEALSFIEYLLVTRDNWEGHGYGRATELIDFTFDLTVDKFSHLPEHKGDSDADETAAALHGSGKKPACNDDSPCGSHDYRQSKIDCRHQYRAFLKSLETCSRYQSATSGIEREAVLARELQKFIKRHLFLSRAEAWRRANPFVSRYEWKYDRANSIVVWMPKYLGGRERARWLKDNVNPPKPGKKGERERVQAIIYKKLKIPMFMPLVDIEGWGPHSPVSSPRDTAVRNGCPDFVEFVATEKATKASEQMPAIAKLGPSKIERLVRAVFDNLASEAPKDGKVAEAFGLSASTFSRFAGSTWHKRPNADELEIPALWKNLAKILSEIDGLQEIAARAGVLAAAREIADGKTDEGALSDEG